MAKFPRISDAELKELMFDADTEENMDSKDRKELHDRLAEGDTAYQVERFRIKYQKRNRDYLEHGYISALERVATEYFSHCTKNGASKLITSFVQYLGVTVETFYSWVWENLNDTKSKVFSEQVLSTCEDATFKQVVAKGSNIGAIYYSKSILGKTEEKKSLQIADKVSPSLSRRDLEEKYGGLIDTTGEEV